MYEDRNGRKRAKKQLSRVERKETVEQLRGRPAVMFNCHTAVSGTMPRKRPGQSAGPDHGP